MSTGINDTMFSREEGVQPIFEPGTQRTLVLDNAFGTQRASQFLKAFALRSQSYDANLKRVTRWDESGTLCIIRLQTQTTLTIDDDKITIKVETDWPLSQAMRKQLNDAEKHALGLVKRFTSTPVSLRSKIFVIGLERTGASKLARFFQKCGLLTLHHASWLNSSIENKYIGDEDIELLDSFDAFCETPFPYIYRELAQEYPDAKFILTTCAIEEWLRAMQSPFLGSSHEEEAQRRKTIYGNASFEESRYRSFFEHHIQQARFYFRDQPKRFLEVQSSAPINWEGVLDFVELERSDALNLAA